MKNTRYHVDRAGKTVEETDFKPTSTNWFICAQSEETAYYFTDTHSFRNWSVSSSGRVDGAVHKSKLGDYSIFYNRL